MPDQDYIGVCSICGDEGTGKSTIALSFPPRIEHMDIDVGGFARAAWRLEPKILAGIHSKSYPQLTMQRAKIVGAQVSSASSRLVVPRKVEGMIELWQQIANDFVDHCENKEVKTIIIDSATLLWNIAHKAHLQILQENQKANAKGAFPESEYREKLQPWEYGTPNDQMRTILHTARSFGKNLILLHYPTDEYGPIPDKDGNMRDGKTGKTVLDGFKETAKLSDLVAWTSVSKNGDGKLHSTARITKCGLPGLGLVGVGLSVGSFEELMNLQTMYRNLG